MSTRRRSSRDVDLAWKILVHDRLRFVITVLGVAFAVSLVLVQVGLFESLLGNASITIDNMGADLWITPRNASNVDFTATFPETRVQRVRSIPGVARADNLLVSFCGVALPAGTQETTLVYALDHSERWSFPWNMAEGDARDLRRGRFFFMDESAARRFGDFAPGDFRELMGMRLEIVGKTREARSFTTTPISFMDYRLLQSIEPDLLRGRTSYVVVALEHGADVALVRARLQEELPWNDVYVAKDWATRCRAYWVETTGLGLNMYLTVGLGVIVGGVIVAQTLYASTMEHLREFATLKTMGATNGDINRILARQAAIAGVVGFGLGWAPTPLAGWAVEGLGLRIVLSGELVLGVLIGTVLLCLAASTLSFFKVSSIDPALVLRG